MKYCRVCTTKNRPDGTCPYKCNTSLSRPHERQRSIDAQIKRNNHNPTEWGQHISPQERRGSRFLQEMSRRDREFHLAAVRVAKKRRAG